MGVLGDVVDRSLPEQASNVVAFLPAVPITIAGANILEPSQSSILYWVLVSVILSTIFAFFGYYVPKPIRLKTTILSFVLWLLLFYGFAQAGFCYSDKVDYSISILLAIGMLFSLIVYFLFKSIFEEVSSAEPDNTDYNALIGHKPGVKFSGGIRDVVSAVAYMKIYSEVMGFDMQQELTPKLFRFGASSLINDVLDKICKLETPLGEKLRTSNITSLYFADNLPNSSRY